MLWVVVTKLVVMPGVQQSADIPNRNIQKICGLQIHGATALGYFDVCPPSGVFNHL